MLKIDVHMANVLGLGAKNFTHGILEELKNENSFCVDRIYVNKNLKSSFDNSFKNKVGINYPLGILSRFFEILTWRFCRQQENHILVLGDIPLNTRSKQFVLCHQSLLFQEHNRFSFMFLKFKIFRLLFSLFLKDEDVLIVQSMQMKNKMKKIFGEQTKVKVLDFSSAHYNWPNFKRHKRIKPLEDEQLFTIIYPSAFYPHKNHDLLQKMKYIESTEIILTLQDSDLKFDTKVIKNIGSISRNEIYKLYEQVDALLFLSSHESLGMPLMEAMSCNLPIICPKVYYSDQLDADSTFFFEDRNFNSLLQAISLAREKIFAGWWSSYSLDSYFAKTARYTLREILQDQ